MRRPLPVHVSLVRNRVIRVAVISQLLERLEELERGVPEHVGHLPELHRHLDALDRDVMSLVEARLGERGTGPEDR